MQAIFNCVFIPVGSVLARKLHPKITIGVIGLLGPAFYWLSSYMPTFELWVICWLATYSLVNGLTYMTPVYQAWGWFPDRPGFASGLIMGGYGLSGLIFNNVALLLFNPQHLSAGPDGLFPQSV
jgi:MFS transporter, OFA family, oxalate/formate antiporter